MKQNLKFCLFFRLLKLKLLNHSEIGYFLLSLVFNSSVVVFESKFFAVFVDISPKPDPGSQNLVDSTDPDPRHW